MRTVIRALAGILLLVLGGCSPRMELHIAHTTWVGYESLPLAAELDWLPDTVVLHRLESAEDTMRALREGSVQGAALTLDEALRLRDDVDDLIVVLVMDESAGSDMLLAKPEITRLDDLAGQRVAYQSETVSELLLRQALESVDLSPGDVTLVDLPVPQHVQAYGDGRVDAIVAFPPTTDRVRALGARRLFDSRDMPGTILDVLAVRRSALVNREESLAGVLRAHFRALEHLRLNRDDAIYRIAEFQGSSSVDVQASLAGIRLPTLPGVQQYLRPGGAVERASLRMIDAGLLASTVDLGGLTDARYLPTEVPDL